VPEVQTNPKDKHQATQQPPADPALRQDLKDAGFVTHRVPHMESPYLTRFLAPAHEEIEAAAVLLRKLYPELSEEILTDCLCDRLNVDALNKSTVVYVAVRKSYGRKRLKEAQTFREDRDGARITVHTPVEELAQDVHILGPVRARDHWNEGQNGWSSEINRSSFLNAIGALATPWAVIQPDAPSKKQGELPKYIMLQSC
jgi:hypothetical protein